MRKIVLIGIWALLAISPSEQAFAQTTPNPIQSQANACYGSCVGLFRACDSNTDNAKQPGICNTTYVLCTISCQDCLGALTQCVRAANAAPEADAKCLATFNECRRPAAQADAVRSRTFITFDGGDGRTPELAVIIKGALNTREGIAAESLWVGKTFPTWRKDRQTLVTIGDKRYDRIEYVVPDGARSTLFFDITDFFGKL